MDKYDEIALSLNKTMKRFFEEMVTSFTNII